MKNKIVLIAVTLVLSNVLVAQQVDELKLKSKVAEPNVNNVPQPGSKPTLAPQMSPSINAVNITQLVEGNSKPIAAPSPFTKDATVDAKSNPEKLQAIAIDGKVDPTAGLTAQQKSTLNGTFKKPAVVDQSKSNSSLKPAAVQKINATTQQPVTLKPIQ